MKDDSIDADSERLLKLSEEVTQVAGTLTRLSIGLRASLEHICPASKANEPHVLLKRVTWLIQARRKRASYIASELLGEPAWDILLNLFLAELSYERISVSCACNATTLPSSTALRWLGVLEHRGLVIRQGDERDPNGSFLLLSPKASEALRCYLVENMSVI